MEGSLDDGLVDMSCSSLINNDVGITGTDVLLNIDGSIMGHGANVFTLEPGQMHFDICYEYRDMDQVMATGNYWSDDLPVAGPTGNYQLGCLGDVVSLLYVPYLTQEPTVCTINRGPCGGDCDCDDVISEVGLPVGEQFETAYLLWVDDSLAEAEVAFDPISEVMYTYYDPADVECQIRYDIAWVFAPQGGGSQPLVKANALDETVAKIKIVPNPAGEKIQVLTNLTGGAYEYVIMDMFGNDMRQGRNNDGESIDVRVLNAGIYLLEVITSKGRMTSKFVKR